ncbi:MAG: tetratricopeptide repeat-containing sensor histidine kinase [Emticicia sp.]|uniref:tetratricopeptide repeat-containing sensor histidine kinase n=1 Tax=Emticicia sp. TaxID=1930953 RepID=UPI003BA5279A
MKKIFVFLFVSFCAFGQNKDSLLKVINSYKLEDTLQCQRLSLLIELESDHKIWIKYNNRLTAIALKKINNYPNNSLEKRNYLKFLAIAYQNQGAYYNYTDDYHRAIEFYQKSLSISIANDFHETTSSNYQNIGTAYDFLGNLEMALSNFNKALTYAYKSKSKEAIAYVLTDLGFIHNNAGNSKKAVEFNFQALKIFRELHDNEGIERTCFAIGRIFDVQKEFLKSEYYYNECLKIANQNGDYLRQGLILNSLANANILNKNLIKGTQYATKSLELTQKHKLIAVEGVARRHLGEIAFLSGKDQEAIPNLQKSIKIFEAGKNLQQLVQVQILLGRIYLKRKNFEVASDVLMQAYRNAKTSSYPAAIKEAAELLSELYAQNKNYNSSYKYLLEAKILGDSLFQDENKNIALKTEFKYETEKKEAQIKDLSQQKQISDLESTRKTTLIYSILGAILALGAITYFSFTRFKTKKENELLQTKLEEAEKRIIIEQKATESELKALKSQMNPHFMFNALNSIQEQFMFGDKKLANEQMGNFTYLTRQILTISGKKRISLSTEVEVLTKYLELEKMRFTEDFEYNITLSDTIDEDYHQIPPMLIQPFVENSIKHGLLHKIGNKKLSIVFDLSENEENLICIVEDNGIGREKSAEIKSKRIQQHESFSTSATEERLRLLNNGLLEKNYIIYEDLQDQNQQAAGTRVTITIPL